ncbi:MAG: AzlD domain-containing protein [Burkholderiaceae bacterium]
MIHDEPFVWLAIATMGLVTLATRVGGVYLGRFVPSTPFWRRFLDHLPATLLLSIAVPTIFGGEVEQVLGAVVTFVLAARRVNLIFAMAGGMAVVAAMRAIWG